MRTHLLPLAALLVTACSCPEPTTQAPAEQATPWTDQQIEAFIDQMMPQLTLEEKVKMCHAQSKFSTPVCPRLGLPDLWYADGPHGVRPELEWDTWGYANQTNDTATAFPTLTSLAATFNPDLARRYGHDLGEEALMRNKDVMLGPGVNIYRTPLNGRNFEYLGEDPFLASQMVVPYIEGMQRLGVAACVKHFALNNQEWRRGEVDVRVSDRALREIYLPAFRAAVQEANVWTIMGAYNKYEGENCNHNGRLNRILRDEWGFTGCFITDWAGVTDTRSAALNGVDLEMGYRVENFNGQSPAPYDSCYLGRAYLDQLRSGALPMSSLDAKVRNVLRLLYRTRLCQRRGYGRKGNPEHVATCRAIADEGIVLLKNDGGLLPLDTLKPLRIAVIGDNATRRMYGGGAAAAECKPFFDISPLEGIRRQFPNAEIVHSQGYDGGASAYHAVIPSSLDADSLRRAAIETAKSADVVLFFGGLNQSYQQDCEDGDRVDLTLPFQQDQLIADLLDVNPRLVLTLVAGSGVTMPWLDRVPAILQGWRLGCVSGLGYADVLSGRVNPSGKLPFTIAAKLDDWGPHSFNDPAVYPGSPDSLRLDYREDILVGYRWFNAKGIKPLFAFGHGLSYTTFELRDARMTKTGDKLSVAVQVTNTGAVAGQEVVQVYVGRAGESAVRRAPQELKGFAKVMLQPGEQKRVVVDVAVPSLAYWDEQAGKWQLEAGKYVIGVGDASDRIAQTIDCTL